jgi:hypothetical protein
MKLRLALSVLALTGLSVGVASVSAHNTTIPTDFDFSSIATNTNQPGWNTNWDARLESDTPACIRNRTAQIIGTFDGERRVVDEDRSSRNGFIRLGGEGGPAQSAELERLVFKVLEKRVGPSGHRHVCTGPNRIVQDF